MIPLLLITTLLSAPDSTVSSGNQHAAWITVLRDYELRHGREAWSQEQLQKARGDVNDPLFAVPERPGWLHQPYLFLLQLFPVIFLVVLLGGAVMVWRRTRRGQFSGALKWSVVWYLLLWVLHSFVEPDPRPAAIVRIDGTFLRQGNGLSYPPHVQLGIPIRLAAGVEAVVRTQRANGWVQVELPGEKVGWVPQDAVYIVEGRS